MDTNNKPAVGSNAELGRLLTDDQIDAVWDRWFGDRGYQCTPKQARREYARAIQAATIASLDGDPCAWLVTWKGGEHEYVQAFASEVTAVDRARMMCGRCEPLYRLPPALEVRADGQTVRRDRWEWGMRRIVALLWGNRHEFEIDDVVEAVRKLVPAPHDDGDSEALAHEVQKGLGPNAQR